MMEALRAAYLGSVANFSSTKVEKMLLDAKIVRHRGKIESAINNAQRALELRDEFGSLAHFFWQFEPEKPKYLDHRKEMKAHRPESTTLSKELKKRGWSFVGPTTCYSLMQAMGGSNVLACKEHLLQAGFRGPSFVVIFRGLAKADLRCCFDDPVYLTKQRDDHKILSIFL